MVVSDIQLGQSFLHGPPQSVHREQGPCRAHTMAVFDLNAHAKNPHQKGVADRQHVELWYYYF